PGGDVVRDFMEILGIKETDGVEMGSVRNTTWGARQIAVARILNPRFNRVAPSQVKSQRLRNRQLKEFLETLGDSPKFYPARSEAEEFFRGFEDDNEWVRQRFFPEQRTLFDETFDMYPE